MSLLIWFAVGLLASILLNGGILAFAAKKLKSVREGFWIGVAAVVRIRGGKFLVDVKAIDIPPNVPAFYRPSLTRGFFVIDLGQDEYFALDDSTISAKRWLPFERYRGWENEIIGVVDAAYCRGSGLHIFR